MVLQGQLQGKARQISVIFHRSSHNCILGEWKGNREGGRRRRGRKGGRDEGRRRGRLG